MSPFRSKQKYPALPLLPLDSSGLVNGVWAPQYGAASSDRIGSMPIISIPLEWEKPYKTTKSFAITVIDYDTIPIMGFPWIHWVAANIPATITYLPENASTTYDYYMCQGLNSFAYGYPLHLQELQGFMVPREYAAHYGGFVPINFPHNYTVTLYALDAKLDLTEGYTYNEFFHQLHHHLQGIGELSGIYDARVFSL